MVIVLIVFIMFIILLLDFKANGKHSISLYFQEENLKAKPKVSNEEEEEEENDESREPDFDAIDNLFQ